MSNTTEKLTDRKIYTAIAEGTLEDLDPDVITAWAERKINQLDKKAAKAKETAAAKKAEGDALTAAIEKALTDEFMTLADIAERVETEDEITASKISYRLNALYKTEGSGVEKGEVVLKNEDGKTRKLVGYRKVG